MIVAIKTTCAVNHLPFNKEDKSGHIRHHCP
jgi:hypothetical protein